MLKNKNRMKKFHNGSIMRKLVMGTLALFFATLLVMSMLKFGVVSSQAKGGAITRDDGFWSTTQAILPDDFVIKHKVTVMDQSIGTKVLENTDPEKTYENETVHTINVSIPFARERVFQPTISSEAVSNYSLNEEKAWKYSKEKPEVVIDGCDEKEISTERKFTELDINSWGTTTYYKVYTSNSSNNTKSMGRVLFEYYSENYKDTKSSEMMLTTTDSCGLAFNTMIQECAAENGWLAYNGSAIDLYQDDRATKDVIETVKKIEMISVSPVDFSFG